MNADAPSNTQDRELKGWHVLLMFLAFFAVIFAVNGVFLHSALTSFPGEDVKKSYLQGLSYGETLERRAAQADLGWTAAIGVAGGDVVLQINDDAAQRSADGLVVVGDLRRAVTDGNDVELAFAPVGDSEYRAPVGELAAGEWVVLVRAYADAERIDDPLTAPVFEARKTVYLH